MLAVISGSGLYEMEGLEPVERFSVETPYGKPSGDLVKCTFEGQLVVFLPRHGQIHSLPPHRVNYRANIWALKHAGVERIISIGAVGAIRSEILPGSIVIGDQMLDFTRSRISTFFDGDDVVHVDFTYPYCRDMREILIQSSAGSGLSIVEKATYAAAEGPRLETAAEISFFRMVGGDIVGMTAMPEAVLAREAELCYAGIYIVTNYAAGITGEKLTVDEVLGTMKTSKDKIQALLTASLPNFRGDRACPCKDALKHARM